MGGSHNLPLLSLIVGNYDEAMASTPGLGRSAFPVSNHHSDNNLAANPPPKAPAGSFASLR